MSFAALEEAVRDARNIAIVGHGKPDSDCIGSVVGTALYLMAVYPDAVVIPLLEDFHEKFGILEGAKEARQELPEGFTPDLLIVCDCSEAYRIGAGSELAEAGIRTVVIDHHATNAGFGDEAVVRPESSSTCEVLFTLMDHSKISVDCAACLYAGIVGDTGVFRHSCTSPETMRVAASLMEYGINAHAIIRATYDLHSFAENQILGAVLSSAVTALDGQVVFGTATRQMMAECGVTPKHLDGIVDHLINVVGVKAAVFMYETEPGVFKASLRSGEEIAVSEAAKAFGGGGHLRAAGCTLAMGAPEARYRLTQVLGSLLKESGGQAK